MPLIPPMKFRLGRLLVTPGALEAITANAQTPWDFLVKHMACDWGCVCDDDKRLNDEALKDGSRLLSAYVLKDGVTKVWIISEAADNHGNRAATTILLPNEY